MTTYYNRTQGNVPVTLLDGTAVSIAAKGTLVVTGENESSPALLSAAAKGHLVRIPTRRVKVVEAPVEISTPVVVEVPAVETPAVETPAVQVLPVKEESIKQNFVSELSPVVAVDFPPLAASDTQDESVGNPTPATQVVQAEPDSVSDRRPRRK